MGLGDEIDTSIFPTSTLRKTNVVVIEDEISLFFHCTLETRFMRFKLLALVAQDALFSFPNVNRREDNRTFVSRHFVIVHGRVEYYTIM